MRTSYVIVLLVGLACSASAFMGCAGDSDGETERTSSVRQMLLGDGLVISQLQRGQPNVLYKQNFIELYNRSSAPVALGGLSVQYQSATLAFAATGTLKVVVLPDVTVPPGGYFLIGCDPAGGAADLPAVDVAAPSSLVVGASGKVAIARGTAPLPCGASGNRCSPADVVDMLGYFGSSDYEGNGIARGTVRRSRGCWDSNDNVADFVNGDQRPTGERTATAPAKNSTSPVHPCPSAAGDGLVVSQVYPTGGTQGAAYKRDFVELFNRSSSSVSMSGLSLQHKGSAARISSVIPLPDVDVPPGGSFLVGYAAETDAQGTDFVADLESADFRLNPGSEVVVLARVTSPLECGGLGCATDEIVDLVGIAATTIEGNPTAAFADATSGAVRKDRGCTDTNDNAADFELRATLPRNALSFPEPCGGAVPIDPDAGAIDPEAGVGLVISQVYGGGGNGDLFNRDYVEVLNRSTEPVSLAGLSLQIAGSSGDFGTTPVKDILVLPNVVVQGEKRFLVGLGSDDPSKGASVLADAVGPLELDPLNGKVILARTRAPLRCGGASDCPSGLVVDLVGYGTATRFEGAAAAPALGATSAALRKGSGCTDTNDNGADFAAGAPSPQNHARPAVDCSRTFFPTDPGGRDSGTVTDAGLDLDASSAIDAAADSSSDEAPAGDSGCSFGAALGARRDGLARVLGPTLFALLVFSRRRRARSKSVRPT